MATVLPNPAWPVADVQVDTTAGPPSTPGSSRQSLQRVGVAVTQFHTQRGRQYEKGLCEAGTAVVKVRDPKEYLNPSNGSSPFQTGPGRQVLPYRSMSIPVLWPAGPNAGNLCNPNVRASYDPGFENSVGGNPGSWNPVGGTTTCVTSTAQHFQGSKSMLVTQSAAGVAFGATMTFKNVPRFTYTFSCYVYPTGGCSVQLQIALGDGTTVASATASTQNTWTRVSATWNSIDTLETVTVYGAGTTTPTWYLDAYQLEWGAAASTFTAAGPALYSIYTGYVERWPQTWLNNGSWGMRPLECVDALAPISRMKISQSYLATIQVDNPQLYLPLSDSAGPGVFAIGGNGFLSTPSPSANGSLNWSGDQFLDGTNALVMSQKNALSPPAAGGPGQDTEWNITAGTFTVDTSACTVEVWVKLVTGMVTPLQIGVITDGKTILPDQQFLQWTNEWSGQLTGVIRDSVSGTSFSGSTFPIPGNGFADGQWHYLAFTLYGPSRNTFRVTYDTAETDNSVVGATLASLWGVNNIHFSVSTGYGNPLAQMSVCNWAFYPTDIGASRRAAHYNRGVGYINELSGARVARLCGTYWTGATAIASGFITLAADFTYDTRTLLDVLYEITETENGLLYADRNGTLVWEDRSSRYANQTPIAVFGDGGGAEIPYENLEYDFDPTYVYSETDLSRPGNLTFAPQANSTAMTNYGQRILQQVLQVTSDFDLNQAALFYLSRYGNPKPRIRALTLNPGGNGNMWSTVLGLEISQRVTVKRRVNGVVMSADYYIERISHKADLEQDPPSWTVDLQLSPVFISSAWVVGDSVYGVLGTTTVPVY